MGDGEAKRQPDAVSTPKIDDFLGHPTRRLADWRWLWEQDEPFPVRSHRGWVGRLVVLCKRLLRPFVQVPQNELWERQRVFNLILLEHIELMGRDLDHRVSSLEACLKEGLNEVMRHNDALFTRVDQKLDRYRRETRELSSHLQAALAASEETAPPRLARAVEEASYVALEDRFRGSSEEVERRLEVYRPWLVGRREVLDLGCGRGEALRFLRAAGVAARGVDASAEMVRRCREQGLEAEVGDLFDCLTDSAEDSLDAVVSFHVVEHLPATSLERLIRLAWRALRPGGLLILETPNPLSLSVGAASFWIDPTHRRPIHPASLKLAFEGAGFEDVERLSLNPFPETHRLPELDLEEWSGEAHRRLADRINRLRDRLDDLLYGFQDFAVIGVKGGRAGDTDATTR